MVVKQFWCTISRLLRVDIGDDFGSVGSMWLSDKRFLSPSCITVAALWGLWKLRNDLCFTNVQ